MIWVLVASSLNGLLLVRRSLDARGATFDKQVEPPDSIDREAINAVSQLVRCRVNYGVLYSPGQDTFDVNNDLPGLHLLMSAGHYGA